MMLGQDVHHKTLGIVGFGRIGQALARRARGFAMRVLYHDTCRPPAEVEQELAAECRDLEDCSASRTSSPPHQPHGADKPPDQRRTPGHDEAPPPCW
jgi:D-isomer specific 2-hydroxyacid dehydrogenase, NAD binding domain